MPAGLDGRVRVLRVRQVSEHCSECSFWRTATIVLLAIMCTTFLWASVAVEPRKHACKALLADESTKTLGVTRGRIEALCVSYMDEAK